MKSLESIGLPEDEEEDEEEDEDAYGGFLSPLRRKKVSEDVSRVPCTVARRCATA